jgi:hypothetical protein
MVRAGRRRKPQRPVASTLAASDLAESLQILAPACRCLFRAGTPGCTITMLARLDANHVVQHLPSRHARGCSRFKREDSLLALPAAHEKQETNACSGDLR